MLQIDPDLPFEEVKKKFRRLSILVHPDKNQVISNGNELLSLAVAIMEVLIFSGWRWTCSRSVWRSQKSVRSLRRSRDEVTVIFNHKNFKASPNVNPFARRKACYAVVEEARGRTRMNMDEKRKRLQREAKMSGKSTHNIKVPWVNYRLQ